MKRAECQWINRQYLEANLANPTDPACTSPPALYPVCPDRVAQPSSATALSPVATAVSPVATALSQVATALSPVATDLSPVARNEKPPGPFSRDGEREDS